MSTSSADTRTALEIATAALEKIARCESVIAGDVVSVAREALAAMRAAPGQRLEGPLLDTIQATIAYLQLPAESAPGADEGMGSMLEKELELYQRAAPVPSLADGTENAVYNFLLGVNFTSLPNIYSLAAELTAAIDAYQREKAGLR